MPAGAIRDGFLAMVTARQRDVLPRRAAPLPARVWQPDPVLGGQVRYPVITCLTSRPRPRQVQQEVLHCHPVKKTCFDCNPLGP
jgi:hypothetical protein